MRWPTEPLWMSRRVTEKVERAVLAEVLATLCVIMAFLGEETLFAAG